MRIEQLRPNLYELSVDEGFKLFEEYYERRSMDLEMMTVIITKPKKKKVAVKKKKKDEVTVSPSDLEILKKLGLV
ncbi:MAG: hypothetical protein KAS32_01290 [Candidatus Peribacteraceae bacterium]|nr:hypothetical protein [Candidatus Peribacteraceae bacterium]